MTPGAEPQSWNQWTAGSMSVQRYAVKAGEWVTVALVGDSTGEWLAQELGVTYGGGCEMAVVDMWAGVDVTV